MNENYIMLNGKRVDLTDEQLEKLGLKIEKKDCFKRVSGKDVYYSIDISGALFSTEDLNWTSDRERYDVANYCTDRSLLQQRAYHETLSRLLWRFSMQNDGHKIDWTDCRQEKYYITYDCSNKKFKIFSCQTMQIGEVTWFFSYKTAQRAIDEIILPFMKEHPDFVW